MSAINVAKVSTSYSDLAAARPTVALLKPAEWKLVCIILATGIAGATYAAVRQQAVDWLAFLPNVLVSLELIAFGIFVRRTRHLARMAMGLIAVGLLMGFLACYAVLTFTVLPFANPMVDQQLLLADAALGFSWVDSVTNLALYPRVAIGLWYVYFSILPQLLTVIAALAFLRRQDDLHRFVAVGFLSMILSDFVWWLFPSVGPAAYGMVSADVQQKIFLIANADYGERMLRYATEGNVLITKSILDGVIAFPSMHIVMTCMATWFARRTWIFVPVLVLNCAMPVAAVLQGGHHVMDIFGGFVVFFLSLKGAYWLISDHRLMVAVQPAKAI